VSITANDGGSVERISETLRHQVEVFKTKLIDFSRNNRLLFYRDLKVGTLRLPDVNSGAIQKLLGGEACKLGDLLDVRDDVTARAKVREIRLKAKANEEERGLKTLFVALGFATWTLDDGGRDPMAPLFLLPVEIAEANRPGLDPTIQRAGDLQPNYALVSYVADQYKLSIDLDALVDEDGEDVRLSMSTFERNLSELPSLRVADNCVLGNFDFQKMAMVEDLDTHLELIAENDLIAAMTGDALAMAAIADAETQNVTASELDTIPAGEELFVLDADSSQQRVLHTLLRNRSHGVIQGPPGTGKSQTIANLIAALIGAGQRVLFVAEKRAALDAVMKRLRRVGLGHLVLDLHGADVKRRKIYDGLRAADQIARTTPPADGEITYARFEELRLHLNAHSSAVNEKRAQCDCTLYELHSRLAALPPDAQSDLRLPRAVLARMTSQEYSRLRDLVAEAAAFPHLFLRDPGTPWATADFRDEESAAAAVDLLDRVSSALVDIQKQVLQLRAGTTIPEVASLADLQAFSDALSVGREVIGTFRSSIGSVDVEHTISQMQAGQANALSRALSFLRRDHRQGSRVLRQHARVPSGARALYVVASTFLAMPLAWRSAEVLERLETGSAAALQRTLVELLGNIATLGASLGGVEGTGSIDSYALRLRALRKERRAAHGVVQMRRVEQTLRDSGLSAFLEDLVRNPRPADQWQQSLDALWLQSHIDQAYVTDARLANFDRNSHETKVREFQELDRKRLAIAASRVRRRAAETYFAAKREFPEENVTFQTQLARKIKQLPLRKLMNQAPRVATSLCPCWMASPLSVSQLISPTACFDVVIFDEASQVLPEDAITSIIRGKRTIVAGDRHQLPPTTFFSSSDNDEEDEDEVDAAGGIESILDLMSVFVSPQSLDWHYRSKDERLIAFSNAHIYHNLITFPGVGTPPPAVGHVLVDAVPAEGEEASSSAEVRVVVDLILRHASTSPGESLGVIAMGIKHARRIDAALYEARKGRPELDNFFAERGEETFFCKNLERVQGDERDVIILSIGYGKDRTGKMYYRFGPLANSGGERRLNVAITRARSRVLVTSTFGSVDMDERRLNSAGPRLLKRYIRYAETGGADLGKDQQRTDVEPNAFECDIQGALEAKGLSIVPQWGVSSYRLDLAVQHPERPGSFVMAIECDGATYHSADTARDRDRIRQTHLEALGWRFHRIWSTDWFSDRSGEINRALEAYAGALNEAPSSAAPEVLSDPLESTRRDAVRRKGQRPTIWRGQPIEAYNPNHLRDLVRWIASDGLLRTDEEVMREAMTELGYRRLGARIDECLRRAIKDAHLS
jgi:very-short-patch-repair endonuclease